MADFNYYDEVFSPKSATNDWIKYLNRCYINLTTPGIKVFKLDKKATPLDSLYGEEIDARIYLPPIDIHAIYLDSYFNNVMTDKVFAEQDVKDMVFVFNFEDMVQKILEKKNLILTSVKIQNNSSKTLSCLKTNNELYVVDTATNNHIIFDLTSGNCLTVKKLVAAMNASGWNLQVTYSGNNDLSTNLVDFDPITFSNQILELFVRDTTFDDATDVVEIGDLVLTNKWKLYQINNATVTGNFGWDYATYTTTGILANIDQANLPGNYQAEIIKNRYGLSGKVEME